MSKTIRKPSMAYMEGENAFGYERERGREGGKEREREREREGERERRGDEMS